VFRRGHVAALAALALALGPGGVARAAAPGTLDPGFGSGGVATPAGAAQLFGVAVQPNGDAIAAGQSTLGSALVERFTTAGQPDPSFGSGGQAAGPAGIARAVALQSDGKVVVAGTSGGMFVERLNANGTADAGFGPGGVARAFGGSGAANGVALQPDGKIVVVGSVNPIDTRIAVARFNGNGTLDTSFGAGGFEVVDLGLPYAVAEGVAVQPDGKIVVVGHEQGSPYFAFFNGLVIRLNSNGTLDPSFNGNGVVSYHSAGGGSGIDTLDAVAIQNDGKIVAAGSDVGGPYAIFLRLNSDGSYDSGFGSSGVAALSSGTFTVHPVGAYGVGIAGGGRVVGAGAVLRNGADHRAGLWAVTSSGTPESTFGSGGVVAQQTGVEACGLAVAPDGSLLVVGHTVSPNQQSDPCLGFGGPNAFIARYIGFGPPPVPAPGVTTGSASAISEVSATLSGQVKPNGLATSYHFDYGTSVNYGSSTAADSAGAGMTAVPVSATLTGLTPGTTYHYRIDASSSAGSTSGQDATFTTAPAAPGAGAPSASTGAARSVSEVSATITGQVQTNGLGTTYHVDYGRTKVYGSSTHAATLPGGNAPVGVSVTLSGLHPATTYHYRLTATNLAGTSYGADRTFRTAPPLAAAVSGVARSYRISAISSKNGLVVRVSCRQACSIRGSLGISGSTAKQLGLGRRPLTIGSGANRLRTAGTAGLKLRLTSAAERALRHRRKVSTTLRIVARPIGGGSSVTFSKVLTLKR